jgi:choline dehydrogenase-like flavoprotein
MAMALEFDRLGRDVLVLETGDLAVKPENESASHAQIVDPGRHAPMELTVCRALGGTSWTWGGRCVAYDDIDWIDRPFVADAHWPLKQEDLEKWYSGAAGYLFCGNDHFHFPYQRKLTGGLTVDAVERWSQETKVILRHRARLLESPHIHVCLNSTVVGFNLDAGGNAIQSLRVQTASGLQTVQAKQFILALGGVETTRLLLAAQREQPQLFGGSDGPLGRYYMGHISGKIASIVFDHPAEIGDLDFALDETHSFYRRRFMLTTDAQLENKVLNTAFWPDNPSFFDPSHGSGVLSSVFFALAIPPIGRKLLPEAIRLVHTGPRPYKIAAHLKNAILGAPQGAADIYRILRDHFLRKPKKPGFLVRNKGGKYALHYHAEQVPNPESRITIGQECDAFGLPRAVIDLRYTDQDVQSVIDSHRVLDQALRANGIGRLEPIYSEDQLKQHIFEQASDGYHQVGTTRMGVDPGQSVVNTDLRVHGLDNLYVASSSVFPTSGQANSTFLAVSFGLRLVHHLTPSAGH